MGWSSSPAENERLQTIVDQYNAANPDVNVTLSQVPDYDTKLQVSLAGGSPRPMLRLDPIDLQPVFPVFHKYYDRNPLGNVVIQNRENGTIQNVHVSFYAGELMHTPKECLIIPSLKARQSVEVPIAAVRDARVRDEVHEATVCALAGRGSDGLRVRPRLPGESTGLVPNPTWKRLNYSESWVLGDTYNMSIGQGFVLATPLQVLMSAATIANDGKLMQPTIIRAIQDSEGNTIEKWLNEDYTITDEPTGEGSRQISPAVDNVKWDITLDPVIADFCAEYGAGRTPNPCVRCNRFIKFGLLFERAARLGAKAMATGHYVRNERDAASGRWLLKKGLDPDKDQSYFLYALTQAELGRALFPLGGLTKAEVRRLALAAGDNP